MWSYLEPAPNQWDFSLYDTAFRAAEKYHVRIIATLTPSGPPPFDGGDGNQGVGILPSEQSRRLAAAYIAKVVQHYRNSSALDTWLLVNEPGQPPAANAAAVDAFRTWLAQRYLSIGNLNSTWGTAYTGFAEAEPPRSAEGWNRNLELDWREFWEGYQTAQLHWLADQVRLNDRIHPLHMNPAGLISNLAGLSDNLPAWRSFLDTLGCSIHPAWHFRLLDRDRYALGVSYINDLVRGSIEPKPYWVTELQGGNNIYSSPRPMEPTSQDIAQWVWTSLGAGADRVIFWLLNARREGVESGEWSLLDFEGNPSARLTTAAAIARIVHEHEAFFSQAHPYRSPVTILLSLETMTFEEVYHEEDDPARTQDAHILEALGFYEALSRLGPPPRIKYFDDYDWSGDATEHRVAILPDVRELTADQIRSLQAFVSHGNTLLITGLTGFYGPHAKAWPLAGFPLATVTGGKLKEVHLRTTTPEVSLNVPPDTKLPSRFWVSTTVPVSAKIIGQQDGEAIALEQDSPGGGRVIWIPSPIGIGAWLSDAEPLAKYLQAILPDALGAATFAFSQPEKGCLLRTLENSGTYVTVITNGTAEAKSCAMNAPAGLYATALWGPAPQGAGAQSIFSLPPRETSVVLWQRGRSASAR
jgi:beta-galactosidase